MIIIRITFWLMLALGLFGLYAGISVAYRCIKEQEEGKAGHHRVIEVLGLIMFACSIMIVPFGYDVYENKYVTVVNTKETDGSWMLTFKDGEAFRTVPGVKLGDKDDYNAGDHVIITYGRVNNLANILQGEYNLLETR